MSDDKNNGNPPNVFQLLQGGSTESDEMLKVFKANAPSVAQSLFFYFTALKTAGFNPEQALRITIATFFRSN